MRSVIERRLLVNWRAEPEVITPMLPDGLRPQLLDGHAVVGVCFVRLGHVRPPWLPPAAGRTTESAAHRIAVTRADGTPGVHVLRRDTDSRLAALTGGRLFPGPHGLARFEVQEQGSRCDVAVCAEDIEVDVRCSVA